MAFCSFATFLPLRTLSGTLLG
ncbi:hypothetical protein LINGRAHAP2_LOCUS3891 [Linum grandiflorum]